MTGQRLIKLALGKIGKNNPSAADYQQALDSLNMIINSWAYWDVTEQPIYEITDINSDINLPPYYLEIFMFQLAANEAPAYGIAQNEIAYLEAKAKKKTNDLVYRRQTGDIPDMNPTTMVV